MTEEIKSKEKKKKNFKWKRTGKCKSCGMCCIIVKSCNVSNKKDGKESIDFNEKVGYNKVHETKNKVYYANLDGCPKLYITSKGKFRCNVHGKKKPKICKDWPYYPGQDYYKILKKFCGFRFKKVKIKEVKNGTNK